MDIGDSVLKFLKEQLLPEIGELKQSSAVIIRTQEALVARLERMEHESARRFELIDKRFEQIDRRFEQIDRRFEQIDKRFEQIEAQMKADKAEHARQMELLDKRMERLEVRMEHLETRMTWVGERQQELSNTVGKLALLGDYVRRVDELAAELRELRRRQEEFERRVQVDLTKLLPKPVTG